MAHHHSHSPNTGSNSEGERIINKKLTATSFHLSWSISLSSSMCFRGLWLYMRNLKGNHSKIQSGSEKRTSPVFKWLESVWPRPKSQTKWSIVKIYWTFYNIPLHVLTWTLLYCIYPFPAMQSLIATIIVLIYFRHAIVWNTRETRNI